MDLTEYLDVFVEESVEHIETLNHQLLLLEKNTSKKEVIDEIFRAAHTLKGMSATMGFKDLADLTHQLENVLDDIRGEQIEVNIHAIDILFETVHELNLMVNDIANGGDGKRNVESLLNRLESLNETNIDKLLTKSYSDRDTTISRTFSKLDEFERTIINQSIENGFKNYEINVKLRDDCVLKGVRAYMVFEALEQLGEIIKSEPTVHDLEEENFDNTFALIFVTKINANEISENIYQISEIEEVKIHEIALIDYPEEKVVEEQTDQSITTVGQYTTRKTIRINIDRLDVLMNLIEELVINRGRLEQISTDLNHNDLKETVENITRVSADLQNVTLTMRMVPISTVFNRFPSMVRQISRELNKQIHLEVIGAETELDRTVIDEIGDPLVHLIRNAIDHGIELPTERLQKGKDKEGLIQLRAYHSGNFIFIEIKDDGAGIQKEKVLKKAINNGLISQEQAETLSEEQIFDLMMESGFSTSEEISDLSGRGVGLDVVKNTIEKLGGSISIHSELNAGSTFSIQLPLTLSIMSVLLIGLHDEKYAIPLSSIIETIRVPKDEIIEMHNHKVIDFRGRVVSLVFLKKIFSIPENEIEKDYLSIVIVQRGEKLAGLVVDSFIGQQEIVIKPLGNYLKNIPAISGATILGDGQVALIIDSNAFIKL